MCSTNSWNKTSNQDAQFVVMFIFCIFNTHLMQEKRNKMGRLETGTRGRPGGLCFGLSPRAWAMKPILHRVGLSGQGWHFQGPCPWASGPDRPSYIHKPNFTEFSVMCCVVLFPKTNSTGPTHYFVFGLAFVSDRVGLPQRSLGRQHSAIGIAISKACTKVAKRMVKETDVRVAALLCVFEMCFQWRSLPLLGKRNFVRDCFFFFLT